MDVLEEEVDIFLEHFGVKGMHWGVRNVAEKTGSGIKRAGLAVGRGAKKTGQFIKKHPVAVTSFAAVIASGTLLANRIISVNKAKKVAEIASRNRSEFERSAYMLDQFREVKVRAIMKARAKGTISPEHAGRLASLRAHQQIRGLNKARQIFESSKLGR